MGLSIFFSLNPCFLPNSELITTSVAPLSSSASTVILFCLSTLSSLIFTITSLSTFLLFRSQSDVLSITLLSTVYLLLRLNQRVLSLAPHLNSAFCFLLQFFFVSHFSYILVFSPPQFCSLSSYSCNF